MIRAKSIKIGNETYAIYCEHGICTINDNLSFLDMKEADKYMEQLYDSNITRVWNCHGNSFSLEILFSDNEGTEN